MPIITSEQITPRESMQHDWDKEDWEKRAAHDIRTKQMELEAKKLEIKLKQEDATKARRHQQSMKELELAIKEQEARWTQLYRLPILLLKLPVALLFGFAIIIATIKSYEITSRDFWAFLK